MLVTGLSIRVRRFRDPKSTGARAVEIQRRKAGLDFEGDRQDQFQVEAS